jgi:two-component system, cell cycle response regulator DivK
MAELEYGPDAAEKKKKFIMVVDGIPKDSLTTGMILQNFGYSVTTVKTAEEVLEFLAIAVPSLVIAEFILPGMNGIDLLGRMGHDSGFSKVPVIVQTSHPDPSTRGRCLAAGCVRFLRKPVKAEDLYRAIQQAIEPSPRQAIRISTYLRAAIDGSGEGGELITVLSENGMFIKTLTPRPVGSQHMVSFMLNRKNIKVAAAVLYCYGFEEGPRKEPGMGMKFVTIDPADRALIQAFIEEHVTPGFSSNHAI